MNVHRRASKARALPVELRPYKIVGTPLRFRAARSDASNRRFHQISLRCVVYLLEPHSGIEPASPVYKTGASPAMLVRHGGGGSSRLRPCDPRLMRALLS